MRVYSFSALTWGLIIFLLATPVTATDKIDPVLEGHVRNYLAQLASPDYKVREEAASWLEECNPDALPLLEQALTSPDLSPEVRLRLDARVSELDRKAEPTPYENTLEAELKWNRSKSLAAYEQGKHTSEKWDAAAREAFVLSIRPRFDPHLWPEDAAKITAAMEKAIDLGCDDPYLLFCYAQRLCHNPKRDPRFCLELMREAAGGVLAGNYPAFRKLQAAAHRAHCIMVGDGGSVPVEERRAAETDFETALELLPAAVREAPPRGMLIELALMLYDAYDRISDDPAEAIEKVLSAIGPATTGTATAMIVEADYALSRLEAMDAGLPDRSARLASEDERAELRTLLRERAKRSLDRALAIDPKDPVCLNLMLRYIAGGELDRPAYEDCFVRALAADPGNLHACQLKRDFLQKLNAREDLLAFARQCLATRHYASKIPLVAIDIHLWLSRNEGHDKHFTDSAVWADCEKACETYLRRYPQAQRQRALYARLACWGRQWEIADAQFQVLGQWQNHPLYEDRADYERLKKEAATRVNKATH